MKLACITILLVLLASDAWAEPVRTRILDELHVASVADGWDVDVAFQVPAWR